MHRAPDAGGVCRLQQASGAFHVDRVEPVPVLTALVAVAEVGGGVEQGVAPGKGRREAGHVEHVALDDLDRDAGELLGRFPSRPRKRFDPDAAPGEQADEVVAEQARGACDERGLHGGMLLQMWTERYLDTNRSLNKYR